MNMSELQSDALGRALEQLVEMRKKFATNGDGWEYRCIEDFVLREGRPFDRFSKREDKYQDGHRQHCYHNAYLAATRARGRLRYVEGYALGQVPIPVLHAWCIDAEDGVVDTTWRGTFHDLPLRGTAYYGVIFPIEYVRSVRTRENGSIIDRWQDGWPLLQRPFRVDTVL